MENYHITKQEQFNQEDRAIVKDMDLRAEKRANETTAMTQLVTALNEKELLRQENEILLEACKKARDIMTTYNLMGSLAGVYIEDAIKKYEENGTK